MAATFIATMNRTSALPASVAGKIKPPADTPIGSD
jgi:hypothetical protein